MSLELFLVGASVLHAAAWLTLLVNGVYMWRSRRRLTPTHQDLPRLSLLIPARNEEPNLKRLLPTLVNQDYGDFEAIVYDDASTDGTSAAVLAIDDARFKVIRGEGPPPGVAGKVNALITASKEASGDVFLFLDADTEFTSPDALRTLIAAWNREEAAADGHGAIVTGWPRLRGGGLLLVSLVPFAVNIGLPLPLVSTTRNPRLSALNGQCWLVGRATYERHQPHAAMPGEVLEDVQIGRLLKRRGVRLVFQDLRDVLSVYMYRDHGEAWGGFCKNVYLLQGGTPWSFVVLHGVYVFAFFIAPLLSVALLVSAWALKAASDILSGMPARLGVMAPISLALSAALPVDSAIRHWTGRVEWKGRRVAQGEPR